MKLVAIGGALLVIGLVVYAFTPAVHTSLRISSQDIWIQDGFPVQAGSLVEQPRNITVFSGMPNELRANLTVSEAGGIASSIRFDLLAVTGSQSCSPSSRPPIVLVDQLVSNQSFDVPLNSTGTYCFVFDNQVSQALKSVNISARDLGTSKQVLIARDGSANAVGLGLGSLGLVVAVYGYSRKSVIPWE